jgi:hypothetical protein
MVVERIETGSPKRFSGVTLEITKQKSAEENRQALEAQLQQAQKMESIGQLAASTLNLASSHHFA